MSKAYRIVALQAVAVAILAAVVYLAFLRPDEPSGLSGIKAGDGPSTVQHPPDDKPDRVNPPNRDRKPDKGPGDHRKPDDRSKHPRAQGNGRDSELVPLRPPTDPVDEPSGSQYVNTVARILARLAVAGS